MKLIRNTTENGSGKFAAIRMDKVDRSDPEVRQALAVLEQRKVLEWGGKGDPDEFFLIKLKDKNSQEAFYAYAANASHDDPELAAEVSELARRAGPDSPWCKKPD